MRVAFLIPGELTTRTGGYEYDRRMIEGLRGLGWTVDVHGLDGSFPQPTSAALDHAARTLAALPDGARVLVDGLALGAMPDAVAPHAARLRVVALVHHPLALETGLDPETADRLLQSERRALAQVRGVVVTSPRTVGALDPYEVSPDRVSVVQPGTDPAPVARGSADGVVQMVCVASLSPRKGHAVLIQALAGLRHTMTPWRLVCVGSLERDVENVAALQGLVQREGLSDRVQFAGEADAEEIGACYDRSDVFVLPTFYEGYGMVIAEALARGLPVISTPTGAIADLVSEDCGILVAAGDVAGWTAAVTRVLDPATRARLAAGARRTRATLRPWSDAAQELARALERHG